MTTKAHIAKLTEQLNEVNLLIDERIKDMSDEFERHNVRFYVQLTENVSWGQKEGNEGMESGWGLWLNEEKLIDWPYSSKAKFLSDMRSKNPKMHKIIEDKLKSLIETRTKLIKKP